MTTAAAPGPTKYINKSITVPSDLLADVEAILGDGNFSSFVSESLRLRVQAFHRDQIIAEWEAAHGPVPEDLVAARAAELASA